MYEELVKELRDSAEWADRLALLMGRAEGDAHAPVMRKAADAIEFLQTYKVCFENMVQIGGWWLVGQDKALHRMNVPMNWPPKGTKTVGLFPLPEPPKEET